MVKLQHSADIGQDRAPWQHRSPGRLRLKEEIHDAASIDGLLIALFTLFALAGPAAAQPRSSGNEEGTLGCLCAIDSDVVCAEDAFCSDVADCDAGTPCATGEVCVVNECCNNSPTVGKCLPTGPTAPTPASAAPSGNASAPAGRW